MSIEVLRPSVDMLSPTGWSIQGGAGSGHASLADASDATFLRANENRCDATKAWIVGLGAPTIPAGARIKQVRLRARIKDRHATNETFASAYLRDSGGIESGRVNNNGGEVAFTDFSGAWQTQKPEGGDWTADSVGDLMVSMYSCGDAGSSVGSEWAAIYVDVEYNDAPTVTVTAPAEGGTVVDNFQPTVTADYADTEGDVMTAYRVKVFSSAQYGAGGFDPETSTATWDSDWVTSSVNPISTQVATALSAGTWRAYVKARHGGPWATPFESAWDYNQFTISGTPPPVPTVDPSPDDANGRIGIVVYETTQAGASVRFDLEFSDDQVTWTAVRGGTALDPDDVSGIAPTVYDYEAIPRRTRYYRARSWKTSIPEVLSAWSTPVGEEYESETWRLHVPSDPLLNRVIQRHGEDFGFGGEEPSAVNFAINRRNPVVVKGQIRGEDFPLTLVFETAEDWEDFEAIRDLQEVLFLITDMDKAWHVALIGRRGVVVDRTVANVEPWWHTVSVQVVEQDRPD